jgi:signal transduction histidine kinase
MDTYLSFIHPEDLPALNEYIAHWKKTKGVYQTEYRIIRKDGALRHVWVRANLVEGKLMGALMDITERKQAEEKLRRSEALLLQSEKIANIGAFDWNADVSGGTGSPQLYKILGFDEPEFFVIGDFLQLMHPEDVPRVTEYIANWLKTGGVFETEYRIMRKNDGAIRHVWVRGDVVAGRLMGYLMDITERVEMERSHKKLAMRNDELDNFVYTASHDLRAPLNNMGVLVEYLSEEMAAANVDAKGQFFLNMLTKCIGDLKNTLEDLTTVTEIHPGEKKELVDLKAVVEEVQASLSEQIKETEARVQVNLTVPFLTIPKKHARSLVFNLLSNALKFRSPERKPVITISSTLEKDKTRLSIADNGIGIRAANQSKVFMIFKRFNPEVAGRGVGMYLVKRVIDLNGGGIYLESKENVGTTFHVEFPIENY